MLDEGGLSHSILQEHRGGSACRYQINIREFANYEHKLKQTQT